ncbi:MAG: 50S ribosomal protein L13 [Planctomycetota bacterium]
MRQTTFLKTADVEHKDWYHLDADGLRLGRLATEVARVLQGKHRPDFTPHVDTGSFVIITNAEKVEMTGDKFNQRLKTRYSGHPGGLKAETYGSLRDRRPEFLLEDAVRRMLPKGRLGRRMFKKLKVYRGSEHPHTSQQPQPFPYEIKTPS